MDSLSSLAKGPERRVAMRFIDVQPSPFFKIGMAQIKREMSLGVSWPAKRDQLQLAEIKRGLGKGLLGVMSAH